ncbi:MAG TPA: type II toxin-antitoxin system RelE/ParE family toxin [Candidatus Paceibacterota bacterium]|nr:type II toxin-antitoxin system RelE/ParE family toxin [Candidatus Paceibacterota bacterium]
MDKIAKLLKKLSPKERERLEEVLGLLISGTTSSLDIKKLKGADEVFRVRLGESRIIFQKRGGEIRILEVSRRDESTYKNY